MADLSHYLELLGVEPDATMQEISTHYFVMIKKFPENPTEEQEEAIKELQHAFSIVRRAYAGHVAARPSTFSARTFLAVVAVLAILGGSAFAVLNASAIQIMMNRHEVGDVLRWKNQNEPYGTVVGYEEQHLFHAGPPSAAFEIRLTGEEETIWIGERLAVKGMVRTDPAD